MSYRTSTALLVLAFSSATACFQKLDTAATTGTQAEVVYSGTGSVDAGALDDGGCNENGCGCNATGTCTLSDCEVGTPACPTGSGPCFLQYGAGGGSFCMPDTLSTPPINLNSDNDDAGNTATDPCVVTEKQSMEIRTTFCAPCHGGGPGQSMAGFDFVLDDAKLVTEVSAEDARYADGGLQRFVVPGDCDNSRIYHRIWAREMPPAGHPAPSVSDMSILRTWIGCLAASPGQN